LFHFSHQFRFVYGSLGIGDLMDVAHDALFVDQERTAALDGNQDFVQTVVLIDGPLRINQHRKRQLEPCGQALSTLAIPTAKNKHLGLSCLKLFIHSSQLDGVALTLPSDKFAHKVQHYMCASLILRETHHSSCAGLEVKIGCG